MNLQKALSVMPLQVPGFTHPVEDVYLEDVLSLIGYADRLLGRSRGGAGARAMPEQAPAHAASGRPQPKAKSQRKQQQQAVPQEQREVIEAAVMAAFLGGSDEDFDRLLEVRAWPPSYLAVA